VARLALDHCSGALGHRVCAAQAQQRRAVADRRQWIAQFVGEHRQEVVLAPVGLAQRGFQGLARRHVADDR
jgi:hypothetical protein